MDFVNGDDLNKGGSDTRELAGSKEVVGAQHGIKCALRL